MNQNDLQPLANPNTVPPGLVNAARVRGEQADAATPARSGRTRASSEPARSTVPAAPAAAPGPDLLVPAGAVPDAAPATDLVYEAADNEADDASVQMMREEAAADARREEEADRAEAKRDAEQETPEESLLLQDEATQPIDPEALLMIEPDELPESGPGGGKGKRRAGSTGIGAGVGTGIGAARAMLEESGDRLHRIAVVAHLQLQQLRAPRPGRVSSVSAAPPKSRAACLRRCGHDGFCDPSDPLGCGGVHCGQARDMLY